MMTPFKNIYSILCAALISVVLLTACSTKDPDTVVFLVRHAEKVTGENAGRDPALTVEGQARAGALAERLGGENITHVHSSDYIRTRDTAANLAKLQNLEIEIYDPRDLPTLAAKIKAQGGRHLVVGHSNTIPETVVALGGAESEPIEEATEYDRIYTVRISGDVALSELNRYGVRYFPETE